MSAPHPHKQEEIELKKAWSFDSQPNDSELSPRLPAVYSSVKIHLDDELSVEDEPITDSTDSSTPQDPPKHESYFQRVLKHGTSGIKKNLVPALCLQAFGILLVILYYTTASVERAFNRIADLKSSADYGFSFLSTGIFGGAIPSVVIYLRNRYKTEDKIVNSSSGEIRPHPLVEAIYISIFWGLKGMEIDAFYRLQAVIFGTGATAGIVIAKVVVDQFVYNPLWAVYTVTGGYMFKDLNFNFRALISEMSRRDFWFFTIPSVLLTTWIVWIPCVSIIYCFPGALQIPLFNICLCFWSLVLALIAKNS